MFKHFKTSVFAGVLCGTVLLSVMPSLGLAETVRNFHDPEGRFFQEYQYIPVALRARAKLLLDKGHFMNTEMYRFMKNAHGFQAAEDYRFAWILSDLTYHMDVMKECIDRNTFATTMPE